MSSFQQTKITNKLTTDAVKEGNVGLYTIKCSYCYVGLIRTYFPNLQFTFILIPHLHQLTHTFKNFTFYQTSLLSDPLCSVVEAKMIRCMSYITNKFRFHVDDRLALSCCWWSSSQSLVFFHRGFYRNYRVFQCFVEIFFVDIFSACSRRY